MTQTPQPLTFSLASNALAVFAGLTLGAVVAAGIGLSAGWADGSESMIVRSSAIALGLWAIGGVAGVILLKLVTSLQIDHLGMGVLSSSMARMLVGLMLSLVGYFVWATDGKVYWASVLVAGLLALGAETSWAVQTLAKLAGTSGAGSPRGSGVAQ